jgi:transposase
MSEIREQLSQLDKEHLIDIMLELREVIVRQEARIQALEDEVAKNSRNSGKPPSSDGLKKTRRQSLREKGKRSRGGQKGHEGKTLCQVENPDKVVRYRLESCPCCQADLGESEVEGLEKRQVFDLPAVRMEVTEHQLEVKTCPRCGERVKSGCPASVTGNVQYGERVKAQIAYLSSYQLLPTARVVELMTDFYGQTLSEATVLEVLTRLEASIQPSLEAIQDQLLCSPVAHSDETGVRVANQTQWLHVLSTPCLTYYAVEAKRGQIALNRIGLVPKFKGWLLHDAFASYFVFDQCRHALCNAHILRELIFIAEQYQQPWASQLKDLLLAMKKTVETTFDQQLEPKQLLAYTYAYCQLVAAGQRANPPPSTAPPKRGRVKQSPAQNLLHRLEKHQDAILAFIHDFRVPFDNNLAERDLRMMKVKLKIAGSFRTFSGAQTFAHIRSYLSTARKQGCNVLDAILSALLGTPFIPVST